MIEIRREAQQEPKSLPRREGNSELMIAYCAVIAELRQQFTPELVEAEKAGRLKIHISVSKKLIDAKLRELRN
jgi:hypothetical protein